MHITTLHAQSIISVGETRATEIGEPANITVIGADVQLKAFSRMDGGVAWIDRHSAR